MSYSRYNVSGFFENQDISGFFENQNVSQCNNQLVEQFTDTSTPAPTPIYYNQNMGELYFDYYNIVVSKNDITNTSQDNIQPDTKYDQNISNIFFDKYNISINKKTNSIKNQNINNNYILYFDIYIMYISAQDNDDTYHQRGYRNVGKIIFDNYYMFIFKNPNTDSPGIPTLNVYVPNMPVNTCPPVNTSIPPVNTSIPPVITSLPPN